MFIHVMLCNISALHVYRFIDQLQSKQIHELLSSLLQEKKFKKFISVTMVMDTPPSYLFIAPTLLVHSLPRMHNQSSILQFIFTSNFHVKRKRVVFLPLLAVIDVLFWRSCAGLLSGGVFITSLNGRLLLRLLSKFLSAFCASG